jgi:[ribosomal protein S5]-alanine N-acetyltransferase
MKENKSIEQRCNFETERLKVQSWKNQITEPPNEQDFAKKVVKILTTNVTKNLPDGWQNIDSTTKANNWIKNRSEESSFLTVQLLSNHEIVGFVFLYESVSVGNFVELRLGFLLSETVWGKGVGSELIKGLVNWCENNTDIISISGGVELENVGSIRVMQKNGFFISTSDIKQENMVFLERKFDRKNF